MIIRTSKGTFDVDYAVMSARTDRLTIRLESDRRLSGIAADFDGLSEVEVQREDGMIIHRGPFILSSITRDPRTDRVFIVMNKGV